MLDLAPYRPALQAFCRRWRVTELALFGSALRDDFGPGSDVDVLLSFEEGAPWSLFDLLSMREELSALFGRSVDLFERKAVERSANPYRRRSILSSSRTVYAA